jgi:protein phosphatase
MVAFSDVGRKRVQNEDSTAYNPELGIAVIADGMGGYKAGEIASALAVTCIINDLQEGVKGLMARSAVPIDILSRLSILLEQAIMHANSAIFRLAQQEPECHGMGTTVLAVVFTQDRIVIAHVGDSRLYRLHHGKIEQLTNDHSLFQELIDQGIFTRQEAEATTPKNLVTRALGIDKDVLVDIGEETTDPDDIYVLCTDGLTDMLTDEEIHLILMQYGANLSEAGQQLIASANERGGFDNVSVILARSAGW